MNNNLGCFTQCTSCPTKGGCCASFNKINSPTLNKDELNNIKKRIKNDQFYKKINENLFQLKVKNKKCIFYQNNNCIIYHERPIDCKLYPFDIIKKDENYYLIIYLLDCININNFITENHNIDRLVNLVTPWIENFTDKRNFTKMKKLNYRIIKKIK